MDTVLTAPEAHELAEAYHKTNPSSCVQVELRKVYAVISERCRLGKFDAAFRVGNKLPRSRLPSLDKRVFERPELLGIFLADLAARGYDASVAGWVLDVRY